MYVFIRSLICLLNYDAFVFFFAGGFLKIKIVIIFVSALSQVIALTTEANFLVCPVIFSV